MASEVMVHGQMSLSLRSQCIMRGTDSRGEQARRETGKCQTPNIPFNDTPKTYL